MAECLYQSYDDNGIALKQLLSDYEQLLIDENIIEDASGKSYRKAFENLLDDKIIKSPSKLFLVEFSKLKSLDVEKRAKCIEETQKDSLKYDYSKFIKFQDVMSQAEGMDAGNSALSRLILTTLTDEDLELYFYKIVTYALMQSIDTNSGIAKKLPEVEDTKYSENDLNNALSIHLNAKSEAIIEENIIDLKEIQPLVVKYLKNNPSTAIISISFDKDTLYQTYIAAQNEVIAAYNFVRNELAQEKYNTSFDKLNKSQADDIISLCPKRLIENQN